MIRNCLGERGIEIVPNGAPSDVRLVNSACPEPVNKPFIFLDVCDHVDALPRRQRGHGHADIYAKLSRRRAASEYELLPIITSWRREKGTTWTETVPTLFERDLDLVFMGVIQYGSTPLSWECKHDPEQHRRDCLRVIEGHRSKRKYIRWTHGKGRFARGAEPLPFDEYMGILRRTKVVVSPWGYGEWCWRDFEAIRAGCVLLKPRCDVVTCPNIYRDGWVEWYDPDHSDLENKIDKVLASIQAGAYPSRQPMVTELLEATLPHKTANVFEAIVKSCAG